MDENKIASELVKIAKSIVSNSMSLGEIYSRAEELVRMQPKVWDNMKELTDKEKKLIDSYSKKITDAEKGFRKIYNRIKK